MPKQVSNKSRQARGLRRIAIWIDVDVLDQLDAICDETGWSRAEIIRDMITGESEAVGTGKRPPPAGGRG